MAQCTAPILGHIRGGGADCPVCGPRYRRNYYSYTPPTPYRPPVPAKRPSFVSRSSSGGGGGGRSTSASSRARRMSVSYSPVEYETLSPLRQQAERIAATHADRRDLFLCHAWDDRKGSALDLYNKLTGLDVKVWFSEKDVPLGTPFMRQIDKGLANSRVGIVLVTPALLKSVNAEGIAEKELSVLLGSGRVIPIVHGTTMEELRDVSPMLASHHGLATADYPSLEEVAAMLADTVLLD